MSAATLTAVGSSTFEVPVTVEVVTYSTPPVSRFPLPVTRTSLFECTSPAATVPSPFRSTAYFVVRDAAHSDGTTFGAAGPAPPTSIEAVTGTDVPPSSSLAVTVTV